MTKGQLPIHNTHQPINICIPLRVQRRGEHSERGGLSEEMSFNHTVEEPLAAIRTGVSQWWDLPQHKQTCWPLAWSHCDIYTRNYSPAWWMKRDGKSDRWDGGREREQQRQMEETKRKKGKMGWQQLNDQVMRGGLGRRRIRLSGT